MKDPSYEGPSLPPFHSWFLRTGSSPSVNPGSGPPLPRFFWSPSPPFPTIPLRRPPLTAHHVPLPFGVFPVGFLVTRRSDVQVSPPIVSHPPPLPLPLFSLPPQDGHPPSLFTNIFEVTRKLHFIFCLPRPPPRVALPSVPYIPPLLFCNYISLFLSKGVTHLPFLVLSCPFPPSPSSGSNVVSSL